MQTVTVTCDHCGRDLTTTGACMDYRLVLDNESIPIARPTATLAYVTKPLSRPHHFCGLNCLVEWVKARESEGAVLARTPAPPAADPKATAEPRPGWIP